MCWFMEDISAQKYTKTVAMVNILPYVREPVFSKGVLPDLENKYISSN